MKRQYPAKAILEMERALEFYADHSRWYQDYPGGCRDGDGLDFGYRAKRALVHPTVARARVNAHADEGDHPFTPEKPRP